MPEHEWAAIAPYVHDVVARAEPLTRYDAKSLYPAVTRLVWFANDVGVDLEDDEVFDPALIDRFTQHKLTTYNRASRNTIRARLRRVSEALLGESAVRKFRALGKAEASRPYSGKGIAELRAWAASQRTAERRTSANALLALGLGAGLTGAEIIATRVEDFDHDHRSVRVSGVGGRVAPVLHEWQDELGERARFCDGRGWAFRSAQRGGNVNLITDFTSRSGPAVDLQARRMRSTWLVHHLEAATPLKVLLRIAGLQSAEALDRILPFVSDRF